MIKKEFSEIKKTLTTANTGFRRMFASYIPLDGDPVKLNTSGFLAKSEDEVELYFELFKKTLSGTIGKQLVMNTLRLTECIPQSAITLLISAGSHMDCQSGRKRLWEETF